MIKNRLRQHITKLFLMTLSAVILSACVKKEEMSTPNVSSEVSAPNVVQTVPQEMTAASAGHNSSVASSPITGADKDTHGCITSAGYIWCAKENKCVRPWEYAAGVAIPNTLEAVSAYCGNQ